MKTDSISNGTLNGGQSCEYGKLFQPVCKTAPEYIRHSLDKFKERESLFVGYELVFGISFESH